MPQISSSEDVYRQHVEESDEAWLYGLVAFAVVEEQRIEWMKHIEEHNGRAPSTVDIQRWYEQQPGGVLLRAKGDTENALTLYADEVLQEILETER
jgi:hypothetical protein